MKFVNTHEAKTHLSRILRDVEQGEEYVLSRAGKAIAKLVPFKGTSVKPEPGKWKGKVVIHQDFDEEDDELTRMFEDSAL